MDMPNQRVSIAINNSIKLVTNFVIIVEYSGTHSKNARSNGGNDSTINISPSVLGVHFNIVYPCYLRVWVVLIGFVLGPRLLGMDCHFQLSVLPLRLRSSPQTIRT